MTFLAELNEQSHPVLQNYSVQLRVICCGIACWRQICCRSPFLFLQVTSASCLCLATEQFVTLKASQAMGLLCMAGGLLVVEDAPSTIFCKSSLAGRG